MITSSTTPDSGAPTRRSNKPVTAFAVRMVESFLLGKSEPGKWWLENTTVYVSDDRSTTTVKVHLFYNPILEVTLSLPDERPIDVVISMGNYFTSDGYPTRTTIERLNGLLDLLGFHGIIPEKVRIFKTQGIDHFVLSDGKQQIAVGESYARNIRLRPDPNQFIIESSDLDINWKQVKKEKLETGYVYKVKDRVNA